MPFAATWMDCHAERSKSDRGEVLYDISYRQNLKKKKDASELIYKTETGSKTQKRDLWLPEGKGGAEGQ